MFTLNKNQFNEFDILKAEQFVDYWSGQYKDYKIKALNSDELIDYFRELNLGNELTEQNVKRLLRWKAPQWLTEVTLRGLNKGKNNENVRRVMEKIEYINDFRLGKINGDNFKEVTYQIFYNGIVYRAFLFHIARPFEYPIADKNVFRAFSIQKQKDVPKDWEGYMHYRDYFFEVSISAGIITEKPKGNEHDIHDIVANLKKVDNALFAFGKDGWKNEALCPNPA